MKKYVAMFGGNTSVAQLTIEREFLHDRDSKDWLSRQLPNYWPVYYNASIHRVEGSGPDVDHVFVVQYYSSVTVNEA